MSVADVTTEQQLLEQEYDRVVREDIEIFRSMAVERLAGIGCATLAMSGANSPPLSANVPVILLSILQLSLPEAVIVGATGALAQGFLNRQTRSRWFNLALGVCVAASAIATADFIYRSLIPNAAQNARATSFLIIAVPLVVSPCLGEH